MSGHILRMMAYPIFYKKNQTLDIDTDTCELIRSLQTRKLPSLSLFSIQIDTKHLRIIEISVVGIAVIFIPAA